MADLNEQKRIKAIREALEHYFKIKGTKYFPFDRQNTAQAIYSTNTRFRHVTTFFRAYNEMLILSFVIPIQVTEEARAKVGEFILRVNCGLKVGNFDIDLDDGEIFYRLSIFCGYDEFAPPTYEKIDTALSIGIIMLEKYGDSLVKVMLGLAEPVDAIDAAEKAY